MEPTAFTPGEDHPKQGSSGLEVLLRKGFNTGVSYMYVCLFEVFQWCKAVKLLEKRKKIILISCFGEISGSRRMKRNILYNISKSFLSNTGRWITCRKCRNDIMLINIVHRQGSIK
ncbi:hypothetical protein F2Q69_00026736 [Brassica cretica]|uniref:ATP synthase YMF19 uncharacterized C-terminal domain-containing protein n=1 Tax=Brassica cretica TaxID=69181 RepID=A0A8S9RWS1_BRACR|nr:hypothetical protein F2Q69_00026736 [Brassica cretica]